MKSYLWLFWVLAAAGLVVDQTTKYGIFRHLYNNGWGGEIIVVENYFTIESHVDFRLTGTWTSGGSKPITLTFADESVTRQQGSETRTGTYKMTWRQSQRMDGFLQIDWENGTSSKYPLGRDGDGTVMIGGMDGPMGLRFTQETGGQKTPILKELQTFSGPQMPVVNQGALFGLGQGFNWVFSVVSIGAAVLIIFFCRRPAVRHDLFLCIALGLILAGTLGNFYDRFVFSGVRDFVHWFIRRDDKIVFDWPVFNIADCCLVVGAGTLLIHAFFVPQVPAATEAKEPEQAVVQS